MTIKARINTTKINRNDENSKSVDLFAEHRNKSQSNKELLSYDRADDTSTDNTQRVINNNNYK